MLLEQYAFQIWSWSISNLEYSSRLVMVQDPNGPEPYGRGQNLKKSSGTGIVAISLLRGDNCMLLAHRP